ncbi:MAG TPA: TetR/AcrR family transcriptional regulator [Microthrixaceae bacterium]|nr:TetR/AcrR family transcriptional regulator [Microthrixaceae bacterium]
MSTRSNQRARTRAAIVGAAADLVREGAEPSIPSAAERALVSVATAYRYFPSADELWFEAAASSLDFEPRFARVAEELDAVGEDTQARLEVAMRHIEFEMLENQAPYRRLAKAALDRWFEQAPSGEERTVVREGRRNHVIAMVLAPLEGHLPKDDVEKLAHALGLIIGTEAMIALTDGVGLGVEEAKGALLDAGRWLLAGALAELDRPDTAG